MVTGSRYITMLLKVPFLDSKLITANWLTFYQYKNLHQYAIAEFSAFFTLLNELQSKRTFVLGFVIKSGGFQGFYAVYGTSVPAL